MKRVIVITLLILMMTAGCSRTRVVSSGSLPVYGTDPLRHTLYLGSDDRYHYFALQHGKSGSVMCVHRGEATVEPEPFPVDTGRSAFVKSAKTGEIKLVELRQLD